MDCFVCFQCLVIVSSSTITACNHQPPFYLKGGCFREDPWNDKCCSNGFCPNSFSTPPPSSNRILWGYFFRRKLVIFFKTAVLTMGIDIFKMTMVKHYS